MLISLFTDACVGYSAQIYNNVNLIAGGWEFLDEYPITAPPVPDTFANCTLIINRQGVPNLSVDPELRTIIERWGEFPHAVKAGNLMMVSAATQSD